MAGADEFLAGGGAKPSGGIPAGTQKDIIEQDWDAAMTVNVKGIWNCCKAVVPAMRQAGGGKKTVPAEKIVKVTTAKVGVMPEGILQGVTAEEAPSE